MHKNSADYRHFEKINFHRRMLISAGVLNQGIKILSHNAWGPVCLVGGCCGRADDPDQGTPGGGGHGAARPVPPPETTRAGGRLGGRRVGQVPRPHVGRPLGF